MNCKYNKRFAIYVITQQFIYVKNKCSKKYFLNFAKNN